MAGELSFFELGVEDPERARAFYGGLFGWRFDKAGTGDGLAISTPDVRGGLHGGDPGATPYLFFRVHDMDAALDQVRELGGTVEDMDVEGGEDSIARFGRFKLCRDDQKSPFGLHQPPAAA